MGIDALMFLALFAGYAFSLHDSQALVATLFGLLVLYLLADTLPLRDVPLPPRRGWTCKFFVLAVTVALFGIALTISFVNLRHTSAPHRFVHDGLIQTEEAVKFLLAGKNPYVEDYTQTPMRDRVFEVGDLTENPALYHNPYFPFLFLFMAPFYAAFDALVGWFDGRMVFLPMFVGMLLLLARETRERSKRYALMWFVALNPFFITYFAEGRNDVFVLFWLALSIYLLRAGRETWSQVALGLACASKLTAWFLIPFYALYLLRSNLDGIKERGRVLREDWFAAARRLWPLVATVAVILLPFLLWNPAAFIDDTWLFMNGASAFAPYPVNGYGFDVFLQTDVRPQDATRALIGLLQWVFGLPVLALLLWRQVKHNTLPQMWLAFALLSAVMGFFAHALNDNHIGFILTLFAIAIFSDDAPGMGLTHADH